MGENIKKQQIPLTIDQQIENLKNLGLTINNEQEASIILNNISYYRLIKGYGLGLKQKNNNFIANTNFGEILELYHFNCKFRQLLFTKIEIVEVTLRCRISNYFSLKYGVLGYEIPDNFVDTAYHADFMEDVKVALDKNQKNPFVRNFQENYEDSKLPLYALLEIISFGTLSKFFKNLKNEDKKAIAKTYNIGYTYFESWLEHLSFIRNICAHYGRIYNAKFHKSPILYKQYTTAGISNQYIFATLTCLKHLFSRDSKWSDFIFKTEKYISESSSINIQKMGFPQNWKEMLLK